MRRGHTDTPVRDTDSKPLSTRSYYILLTLLFLYPIPFNLDKVISIAPDTFQNIWNFWWVNKSLLELHTSPYFTDFLFYPTGTSLVFQTLSPYNSLLAIPLQHVCGIIGAYSILFLLSFPLAAIGCYLLALRFVNNRSAAFLAGFIYGFSPFHLSRAMQVNIFSIQWIPFYCLFLFRLREEKSWRNALGAALFLLLTSMCSWYYMIYLFLFSILFLLYYAIADPRSILVPRFYLVFLTAIGLFLIFISPFALPLLRAMARGETYLYKSPAGAPGLFGLRAFKGYFFFWPVLIGYVPLILSFLAAFLVRKREVRFWTLTAIFSFLMILGTHLSILGREFPGIPLPFALLQHVPLFRAARISYRFLVPLTLSLSILTAFAVEKPLLLRPGTGRLVRAIPLLTLLLVAIEYIAMPRPVYETEVPEFYQMIASEEGDFAIISLPFKDRGWDLFYQTYHEKRQVRGYVSRRDPAAIAFLEGTPPLDLFLTPDSIRLENISPDVMLSFAGTLRSYDIRYVLINKPRRYSDLKRLDRPKSTLGMLRTGLTPYSMNFRLHAVLEEIEKMRSDISTSDEELKNLRLLLTGIAGEPVFEDEGLVAFRIYD